MTSLAHPLSHDQIEAANRLYGRAVQWQRTDRALHLLRERVPEFGSEATLLKAVAINALYSANVYAIVRVAEHIEGVLARSNQAAAGPELVETMATVPAGGSEKRPRRRHSFASKFAHFFIDPERFPILDHYANEMVRVHLGNEGMIQDPERPYVAFVKNIEQLEAAVGVKVSRTGLDHYLLIAGQCRAFEQGHGEEIGAELRELFETGCDEIAILAF